jgi:NADH dehydrogenase FAD-containing subunit
MSGGGPTGVETAGALAEALRDVAPERYQSLAQPAQVHLKPDASIGEMTTRAKNLSSTQLQPKSAFTRTG